jgi:site-specific DNA-methyltransferase (cytosine-N4-specific)
MGYPRKTLLLIPERYRIACLDELGLTVRAVVIWDKPNGLPESVGDRVRRSHEDWVHLTMQPRYFADIDQIREEPARRDAPRKLGTSNKTQRHISATDNTGWKDHLVSPNPKGKLPGSVREVATEPLIVPEHLGVDHHAAFPSAWPDWFIRGWCPADGVVLDPFGGTGTTALVASALGRIGISNDMSADYCRIARWRTSDPAQRARVLRLPKPPVEVRGQASLFDEGDAA